LLPNLESTVIAIAVAIVAIKLAFMVIVNVEVIIVVFKVVMLKVYSIFGFTIIINSVIKFVIIIQASLFNFLMVLLQYLWIN